MMVQIEKGKKYKNAFLPEHWGSINDINIFHLGAESKIR